MPFSLHIIIAAITYDIDTHYIITPLFDSHIAIIYAIITPLR
jgi:hypothetical protein